MEPHTKGQKRALRELGGRSHEAALRRALLPLAEAFEAWKAGGLSSFELSDRIHDFHQEPSRQIWSFHSTLDPSITVAHAVVEGLLGIDEIPDDLREEILRFASSFRRSNDDQA